MRSCVKLYKTIVILLLLGLPFTVSAEAYSAKIESVQISKVETDTVLDVRVIYRLSPTAREAIYKGVPLSWMLSIKLQRQHWFWHETVKQLQIPFVIQFQALLNQYSVRNRLTDQMEMFSSLYTALAYMGTIRDLNFPGLELLDDERYRLALKAHFDREFLPIPLRPESYFDTQWSLSSDWYLWQPRK